MIETLLKYQFKNPHLLQEALTHKSFTVEENSHESNNERLEFLGDSILNFVVAEKLLELFPEEPEGVLSKKRAALVNISKLAQMAEKFQLDRHIQFGRGEIKMGNHLNPRIQGSCLEALIGAIYLDGGFEKAKLWVLDQYTKQDYFTVVNASFEADFKSRLQELTQKHRLGTPVYELVLTVGPSHKPQFVVALKLNEAEKARADGATKKTAEQKAAEIYLNELIKTFKE